MGYYVHIEESNCMLPAKNYALAYWRMCALNDHDELKRGGSRTEKWFSWMDKNYPQTCKNAKEILVELGFEMEETNDGLTIYGYDNKSGQEELFLAAISDLMVTVIGSTTPDGDDKPFIVWRGEDDMVWKDFYGEKNVKSLSGRIVFEESEIGG